MTRHARNCTAGAVYTYHEKKKDAAASGYGTYSQRVGKDSVKVWSYEVHAIFQIHLQHFKHTIQTRNISTTISSFIYFFQGFDCCNLTLQPCRNPVITKDGYLFDKEAILQYIVSKKNEYSRQLKEFERQKKKGEDEIAELDAAAKKSQLQKFLDGEKNIASTSVNSNGSSSTQESVSNMSAGKDKQLPSFWVPSQLPDAKMTKLKKPESKIYCPVTGKPLKLKDLIDIKWTLVKDPDDKKSLIAKENR